MDYRKVKLDKGKSIHRNLMSLWEIVREVLQGKKERIRFGRTFVSFNSLAYVKMYVASCLFDFTK